MARRLLEGGMPNPSLGRRVSPSTAVARRFGAPRLVPWLALPAVAALVAIGVGEGCMPTAGSVADAGTDGATGADAGTPEPGTDAEVPKTDAPSDATSGSAPVVISLSAGSEMTCAVLADKTVRCWGRNNEGQLGNGVPTNDATVKPTPVVGVTDAVAVSAGVEYACALLANGTVTCWGAGTSGRLGNGSEDDKLAPTPVSNLGDVTQIASGFSATCALKKDGSVWCWGRGGDIGTSNFAGSSVPVKVDGLENVTRIESGNESLAGLSSLVCARKSDGTVACFAANNSDGQLGNGTQNATRTPGPVLGVGDATTIAAAMTHACAVRADGTYCWGQSRLVGDGTNERRFQPTRATTTRFEEISAGLDHTCGRDTGGDVYCWGITGRGQAGDGVTIVVSDERLAPTKTLVTGATMVSSGMFHSCAYTKAGKTLCWGANNYGELGNGTPSASARDSTPREVVW